MNYFDFYEKATGKRSDKNKASNKSIYLSLVNLNGMNSDVTVALLLASHWPQKFTLCCCFPPFQTIPLTFRAERHNECQEAELEFFNFDKHTHYLCILITASISFLHRLLSTGAPGGGAGPPLEKMGPRQDKNGSLAGQKWEAWQKIICKPPHFNIFCVIFVCFLPLLF